jgi:HSP20 family protein
MSVVRWDPVRELSELQRSINQLFEGRPGLDSLISAFPVDVYETADEVVVRADLPGVRPEDIQVQHHEGQLFIRVTRAAKAPEGATWLVRQTPEGEMVRSLSLGVPVEVENVQATYDAGVLELRLPKAEHARPRAIPVRAGSRNGRAPAGEGKPADGAQA